LLQLQALRGGNEIKKMRLILVLFSTLILSLASFGQQLRADLFLDEFMISFNKTTVATLTTLPKSGFGLAGYHAFYKEKQANFVVGLEYNHTRQIKTETYEGQLAAGLGMLYKINSIGVPLLFRLNAGEKIKGFVDLGGYIDVNFWSKRTGLISSFVPNENGVMQPKVYEVDEIADIAAPNAGPLVGIGIKVPYSFYELILKLDYKLGLVRLDSYHSNIYNSYFRVSAGIRF
jgi:hypothetical protein